MMFCPNCGTQMPDTAGFCRNCGTKMEKAAVMAIHAPRTSFASAAPVGKGEFLRKYAAGKTKTAAIFALIAMLLSIAVLAFSANYCLTTDVRDIPLPKALDAEEELEEVDDINRYEMEQVFDALEREMRRSDRKYMRQVEKSMEDILDDFSVVNLVALVDACDEVLEEEVMENYGVDPEEFLEAFLEAYGIGIEYETLSIVCDYIIVGIWLLFALPALFVLLGGLNKNTVLSIIALVLSAALQLALCSALWLVINMAVLIVQIILCAVVQKHYRTFRRGTYVR